MGCQSLLHHLATVHHHDAVGNLADDSEVVGDENDARSVFLLQRTQQVQDGALHGYVEGRCRFVGDEDVGVVDQRHGYHHTLLLTAADLVRIAVENLLRPWQQHLFEEFDNLLALFGVAAFRTR